MKNILVIGAGLSSSYLIKYLLQESEKQLWTIHVVDADKALAERKINYHKNGIASSLNIYDTNELIQQIKAADLVISMLPASLHILVAQHCLKLKKHLITASYISEEMRILHIEALKANVLFLNECGLDPGIDHMSAIKLIHEIQSKGGKITTFKSYCGGLISKESDNNPWHYKFTWNPRNVVLAGQNTARYLENNELKFIPASRIFSQFEKVSIPDGEEFECYANRDSLEYIKPYGIESAHTVLRGTMRSDGFCSAWNCIVRLGLNDDSFIIHNADKRTYKDILSAFTPGDKEHSLEERVATFLNVSQHDEIFKKLQWLGIFDDTKISIREGTPAQILQLLLQSKWKLEPGDIDRIVMHHQFEYTLSNENKSIKSTLVVKGEDDVLTAMAKTVGLPLGIAAKLILTDKIKTRGVQMPLIPEIYLPILEELKLFGVEFIEQ